MTYRPSPSDILLAILSAALLTAAALVAGGLAAHPFSRRAPQPPPRASRLPYRGRSGHPEPGPVREAAGRAAPRSVANRPAQPSPGRNVYAMAAPAGAPRRRRVHPGMHGPPTRAYRRTGRVLEGRVCHGCAPVRPDGPAA